MDINAKKCFVFDLDGTVYLSDVPIQGTIDFIKRNQGKKEIFFLTNNTSKNLADYTKKLTRFGIDVGQERILSPLLPLVEHLQTQVAAVKLEKFRHQPLILDDDHPPDE